MYYRKKPQEAMQVLKQALQLIDMTEAFYPELRLTYLKASVLYFCADINYYANNYQRTIRMFMMIVMIMILITRASNTWVD